MKRSEKTKQPRLNGMPLLQGEDVLVQVRPSRVGTAQRYLFTLGLYGLWRERNTSVVTNRRIMTGRGIFRRQERSIPIGHIDAVKFIRRGLNSYTQLAVNDHGHVHTETIGPLTSRSARRFAVEILERL